MKLLFILLFCFNVSIGQVVTGKYSCLGSGKILILRNDSVFFEEWQGHIGRYWNKGRWTIKNNIIILNQTPVFDTINFKNSDTLVISKDTISQMLTFEQYLEMENHSVFQAHYLNYDYQLIYKNEKLYPINSKGIIIKKYPGKRKSISIRNKRLDKPQIIFFSWNKMYPTCAFERVK